MDRAAAREKASALVARMTLEEKASQLRYDAPAIERLGIPAYNWWNEALHGVARGGTATSFPQAIGLAATFDDALIERLGDVAATEARAKYNALSARGDRDIYHGLTFWSPNINIFRDPRWGRGHETYGEDPYLTGRMGQAYVRGLQGSGKTLKTAACAKHFAVHSGPEALRHRFDARATPKDLEETYLPAFRDLVTKANVEAVMGAYNRTNGEPCCGSKALLVDTLRGAWGFAGVVLLLGGSAMDVSEAQERADAVLLAWYPGARGGRAVAELLFGAASPSGKLPVTFYRNEALDELPDFTDYSMQNRTYKYYTGAPLYPFGYGLSYADMALRDLSADKHDARVTVENRSGFDAEQVVELYVKDEQDPDAPTHPILAGFARVCVGAGASKQVTVAIDPAAFTVAGEDGVRRAGSGTWTLWAGFGQPDARTAALSAQRCLSVTVREG